MSTFPLLMSLADELDNLTTRSYLDDFGLGFYPHRHYHRVPSLSLPSEEEWAEQQQCNQQRRNSRSRKYSEPIKENKRLEEQYELQTLGACTTLETTTNNKKIYNNFNDAIKNDTNNIVSINSAQNTNKINPAADKSIAATLNNIDELHILKSEIEKNQNDNDENNLHNNDNGDEKQADYDGYISKHSSSYSINNKYDFPKTHQSAETNKFIKSFKAKKLNLQSSLSFNISKKKEKQQLKKNQQQQSSLEQLEDNEEENSSLNVSPEDASKDPDK